MSPALLHFVLILQAQWFFILKLKTAWNYLKTNLTPSPRVCPYSASTHDTSRHVLCRMEREWRVSHKWRVFRSISFHSLFFHSLCYFAWKCVWCVCGARKGEGKTRSNITCGWLSPTKMSEMTKHEILTSDWLMVKWENVPSRAATIFFREVKKRNFREKNNWRNSF